MIDLRKNDPVADTVKDLLKQEGWDDMVKSAKDTLKDKKQDGGSGMKQGSRYGGSKQKDEKEPVKEELKGNQHEIDKNKNKKIDAGDFKILRKEENVEEALKGDQHKIDKNKNNKIDAQDFKILRKEETVEEGIKDLAKKAFKAITGGSDEDQRKNLQKKMGIPQTGKIGMAKKNEEVELDERSLTPSEEKTKEHNVKSMKKGFAGFRERYGKDAKSVMYATATKQAKNEETVLEARTPQTDTAPFDPPYNTSSGTEVMDKSGAKHTPMSRVKHLARQAMKKVKKDLGTK